MGLMFACSAMAGVDLQNFQINSSVPDPDPVLPVSSSFAPPVSDFPTHDPNVGTLVGQASTDGGAATYQVPIVVPPGRAGMQPSISLNYNSRSGNGIAGIGWTISGLSSIHRCPQTPEQDNPTAAAYKPAVTYTSSDRLCLDGQRLVPFSGAYGVSGTEYRTEVDSYARIFQVGGTGLADNTACFRVEQKDGRIFHYGGVIAGTAPSLTCTITASVNSRALPNSTTPLSWLVEKIEDRVGNNQLYSYLNVAGSGGEVLLQKVTYTGFGAAAGDRVVTFNYEPRSSASSDVGDIASNYLAGALTLQTQALKCITTTVGAVKATDLCDPTRYVRTYTPSYAATAYNGSATHSSRLIMKSLQECATNATGTACHPATHFSFNDGPLDYPLTSLSALALPATTTSVSPYQLYTIGDLDGDGTREVAASFDNRSFLVQLTADRAAHGATELTGTPFCVLPKCYADIDGSGRSSLIQTPASSAVAQVVSFGAWNFSLFSRGQVATSNPFFTVASNIQFNYSSTGQGSGPVYTADFNGDGKMDVAVVGPSASCGSDAFGTKKGVFVWLNAMAGTLTAGQTASFAPTQGTVAAPLPLLCIPRTVSSGHYDEPAIEHIADFDGNGLPDIYLVYAGTGTQLGSFAGIALTQGSGSTLSSTIKGCTQIGLVSDGTNTDDECNWNQNYVTHWMDVNGDGLEDFVIARAAQQTWQVRLNKGNGTLGSVISFLNSLRSNSVLESEAHMFPNSPLRVDVRYPDQFGLRAQQIGTLRDVMIQGSGQ
jgi:hypothetical protein